MSGPEKPSSDKQATLDQIINSMRKTFDTAVELLESNESKEPVEYNAFLHKLGGFELPEFFKIDHQKAHTFVGIVDRTRFDEKRDRSKVKVKEPELGEQIGWYASMKAGAVALKETMEMRGNILKIEFPTLADKNSPTYKRMERILKSISTEMPESGKDIDKIWKTKFKEWGYTTDEIYGEEGAFQLILAFQRAIAPVSIVDILDDKNFKPSIYSQIATFTEIRLKIGEKPNSEKDRCTVLRRVKKKAAAQKPAPRP